MIDRQKRPHTQDAGARKRVKRILNPNGTILQQASSRTKNLFNQVKMNTVTHNYITNDNIQQMDTDGKFFAVRNMVKS